MTKEVRDVKKAYERFLKLAVKQARSRLHAAELLEMNSVYNRFIREICKG